ncbi:unnamed protein product [Moneuplotes crassus]|uniref:Adenylyltransferase and sulfurtransferase MOCS3 homolog n=1 Tax=Euplotes crassus TaxID=5936 RepID=A0AAD1XEH4_EUPCR|nr:unnamed protein product [Moneuplotes crassus]
MESASSEQLSKEEYKRYTRQMIIPGVSLEGQLKLKNAKVLIVGAGGLGSPAALYLSGAGIGTIGLVDGDHVDSSNLHRQVIHNNKRVGINKTVSAKETISDFNEFVKVITVEEHLTKDNAEDLVKDYDIIMDGLDNPKARYILNDACVLHGKPMVSGSALKWEGMVSVYNYKDSSCYRCVYPTPTPAKLVTNCADGGVIGMIPGIIGQLEALEIVKLILGEEGVLTNKMLFFNGKTSTFKKFTLRGKQVDCPVCGENPSIRVVADYDYDALCPAPACSLVDSVKLPKENDVAICTFQKDKTENSDKVAVIDVRPDVQFNIVNIPGSVNIPLDDIQKGSKKDEIEEIFKTHEKVYIMCRRGNASRKATKHLLEQGYESAINVRGGITQYVEEIDNEMPMY